MSRLLRRGIAWSAPAWLLAGCATAPPASPTVAATPTLPALPTVPTVVAPVPAGDDQLPRPCVPAGDAQVTYVDPTHAFCLLYPATYSLVAAPDGAPRFRGLPLATDPPVRVSLTARVTPADAATLEAVVVDYLAELSAAGAPLATATLAGEPAVWASGVPTAALDGAGAGEADVLLALREGQLFALFFGPGDSTVPGLDLDIAALKRTVTRGFAWLPAALQARFAMCRSDVDRPIFLNMNDGYCLPMPAGLDAGVNQILRTVVFTPHAGDVNQPGPRIDLIINAGGAADGRSLDELVAAYLADFSPEMAGQVSRSVATIDSRPLAVLDGVPGTARTRQAFAVYDDRLFVFRLTPFDDPARAGEQAAVEAIWRELLAEFHFIPAP